VHKKGEEVAWLPAGQDGCNERRLEVERTGVGLVSLIVLNISTRVKPVAYTLEDMY